MSYETLENSFTAARTIQDAELLKRGAIYQGVNQRLHLTEEQVSLAYLELDPTNPSQQRHDMADCKPDISVIESLFKETSEQVQLSPIDQWLNKSVGIELQNRFGPIKGAGRASNLLKNMSLISLRDVINVGSAQIAGHHGMGARGMEYIDEVISQNTFGIEWQDEPTVDFIAKHNKRLSQVHIRVLGDYALPQGLYPSNSVQDLLVHEPETANIPVWLYDEKKMSQMQDRASIFASKFYEAIYVDDIAEALEFGKDQFDAPEKWDAGFHNRPTYPNSDKHAAMGLLKILAPKA